MTKDSIADAPVSGRQLSQGSARVGGSKPRVRKVYAHSMTDAEKWALGQVKKAKSACTQIAVAIQNGKGVKPELIDACTEIVKASGRILFQ